MPPLEMVVPHLGREDDYPLICGTCADELDEE
jgi:hypothetical protein